MLRQSKDLAFIAPHQLAEGSSIAFARLRDQRGFVDSVQAGNGHGLHSFYHSSGQERSLGRPFSTRRRRVAEISAEKNEERVLPNGRILTSNVFSALISVTPRLRVEKGWPSLYQSNRTHARHR